MLILKYKQPETKDIFVCNSDRWRQQIWE